MLILGRHRVDGGERQAASDEGGEVGGEEEEAEAGPARAGAAAAAAGEGATGATSAAAAAAAASEPGASAEGDDSIDVHAVQEVSQRAERMCCFCVFCVAHIFYFFCLQYGLCHVMLSVFEFGFKSKTMFGPNRHVWDFISRACLQMKHNAELSTDPESMLHSAVERANMMGYPKTARFEWLICCGASSHMLHVWMELVG